jgi:hypothetical protein
MDLSLSSQATLRAALARGPLAAAEAIRIAVSLCDLLAAGHDPDRDVRPDTLRVEADGVRLTPASTDGPREPYVAPERRRGWSAGDARSDVFLVGTILYEMLVGRTPTGQFPWPGQVEAAVGWIDPVIVRCLADDPAARYPSVAHLRADLLARRPTAAAAPELAAVFAKSKGPSTAVFGGIGLVVLRVAWMAAKVWIIVDRDAHQAAASAAAPRHAVSVATVVPEPVVFAPTVQPYAPPPPPPDPAEVDAMDERLARQAAAMSQAHHPPPRPHVIVPVDPQLSAGSNTPMVGAMGGGPFRKVGQGDRPLLGIAYSLGEWGRQGCLRTVDPLYGTGDDVYTVGRKSGTVVARRGYAVAGVVVQADDTNVLAFAVVFMARRDGHLVTTDQYTSDWVGFPTGDDGALRLGCDGRAVLGLTGRQGMNLAALGLVVGSR